MLRLVRGTFFGPSQQQFVNIRDVGTPFARLPYLALVVVLLLVGCWPKPLLRIVDSSPRVLIERIAPQEVNQFADTAPLLQ